MLAGKSYSQTVDLWSLGILTYVLITGEFPFLGETTKEVLIEILNKRMKFSKIHKGITTKSLRKFIRRCARRGVHKRLTARAAQENLKICIESNLE